MWRFLGYPPLPAWSLSDGRQARQGLDTDVMMFHNSVNTLQMVAPGAAIWLHLATGVGACAGATHAHPTKIFYKSGAHCASGLTFSRLAIGRDTSDTATLVMGTAKHLVQVNKEISLVFCFSSAQLGRHPRGWRRTSERLSLTAQGE